ncbi:limbic system-associated membrane protein [Eurytemora carolleeae]|uniref:limbic system-associated membrane protein n=1 Tax=Eurytemora carolleeae TaxID=1294199 RepID=UPI000C77D312|nr:limbic system-associated membrane protein [Eurytemora carolleeae]|eukprot:XP_023348637.1 limbic system-associated membrane protein-like [Eurytemora affinis]
MKGRQISLNMFGSNQNNAVLGEAILLENISREHAGRYECSANNGVGSAALAEISLTVLYTPEIRMERRLSADRYQIELEIFCTVHAEPKPVVRWYKDSMLLDPGTNRIMESNNNRHKLHVLRMGVADLGNYSCMAENSLGKERGFLQISGEPLTPVITSPEMSFKSTEYTLRWNTVSLLVISEYRVLFRLRQAGYRGDEREWTNIIPTVDSPLNTNYF